MVIFQFPCSESLIHLWFDPFIFASLWAHSTYCISPSILDTFAHISSESLPLNFPFSHTQGILEPWHLRKLDSSTKPKLVDSPVSQYWDFGKALIHEKKRLLTMPQSFIFVLSSNQESQILLFLSTGSWNTFRRKPNSTDWLLNLYQMPVV